MLWQDVVEQVVRQVEQAVRQDISLRGKKMLDIQSLDLVIEPKISGDFRSLVIHIPRMIFIRKLNLDYYFQPHFGPRVYPMGSMVIALVSSAVCRSIGPSLNISETAH